MKSYKLIVENRKYERYSFIDVKTMSVLCDDECVLNPLEHKLFNHDIFTFHDNQCNLLHSTIKSATYIPGVLVLKNDRRFGKYKKKYLYKCIPDDKRLPIFLVPYSVKQQFAKNYVNKYVIFKFKNWDNKHPYGELANVLGNVSSLDIFYEYQLYCKNLTI